MSKETRVKRRWGRRLRLRRAAAALWGRRLRHRRRRLDAWKRRSDKDRVVKWRFRVDVAEAKLAHWQKRESTARTVYRRWRRRERLRGPRYIAGTHFTWAEAKRRSWYPVLPGWVRPAVERHARNLERLRAHINTERARHNEYETGITILSWVRSPAKNAAVGGASQSQHLTGCATDISLGEVNRLCPWGNGRADFDRIAGEVFDKGGVGLYPAGNRHVDSRGYRARWTTF